MGLVVATTSDTRRPRTFVKTTKSEWVTIEAQEGIPYDRAWACVTDLIVKKFDAEILSKEDG